MRYGFAGDRQIAADILQLLINLEYKPSFLMINSNDTATHNEELVRISGLDSKNIFTNKDLKTSSFYDTIKNYEVDYIFGIHYPFIIDESLINMPKIGFLNLHPAYLPFNRGWHTPSWAIYENTKYGATLHFMSKDLDKGDIIHQKEIEIGKEDTANTLYKKVLDLEFLTFKEALPELIALKPNRIKQNNDEGTEHKRSDLELIREISLNEKIYPLDLIKKIRALTTNNIDEAAYFKIDGKKYRIRVEIVKE
ncbi:MULTISPECIES: formyltransferase family protein [Flavobacteriales]|uniref:phosphoribosylglycinamide formyltransferase 1 n=1 Tax=Bergeyella zoohelcum TaxID=1015 RepID=A0A7Z8YPC3_9FLAO|nr:MULTISPECIES: formyltransferase family protein [Flavobacteriales]GIM60945.1 formyl transferase [Capnocytophaga canis]VDH05103.1 formyltransferase [Bergeyella zoohelcum]